MKSFTKFVAMAAIVGLLGSAGTAYAATSKTPADIVSELTGRTVEDLYQERSAGKTYGTIANDAGKLDEFKTQMLEQRKTVLNQRVQDGRLTQEQADDIINKIESNQKTCDGTGSAAIGRAHGAGFGQGCGMGNGQGAGKGAGMRNGNGMGFGRGMNS